MPFNGGFTILADDADDGRRLDVVIASRLSDCSRSLAATLISSQNILVDGRSKKPGYRVKAGDKIQGRIPSPVQVEFRPEPIALHILYEDAHILVINKQPGLVAHPSPGHYSGTLVNALLYHCPDLVGIGGEIRPGIVHRLDKDTSGTMVVAKTASAHENLAHQFKTRKIQKTYLAIVYGEMQAEEGAIRLPIGRHPVDRKRMSTTSRKSRQAESRWRVQQRFQGITILEFDLKTGRTHQIRVHCAAINHPIVGDAVYGPHKLSKNKIKKSSSIPDTIADLVQTVRRQMLHAWRLGFTHPAENKIMTFESPIPSDMANLIDSLRCVG